MRKPRGFTLTEVMIAGTITVAAIAAATSFLLQSTRNGYEAEQKHKLSSTSRNITSELLETAALANLFVLYTNSDSSKRDEKADRLSIDTNDPANWLRPSADLAVFVFFESPKPNAADYHRIKRIVCYYTESGTGGGSIFRRKDMNFAETDGLASSPAAPVDVPLDSGDIHADYLEKLLADYWSKPGVGTTTLHENIRGLALSEIDTTDTTPRIFYYNDFRTVTINMQLFSSGSGGTNSNTNDRRTLSTSLNFTITPRT